MCCTISIGGVSAGKRGMISASEEGPPVDVPIAIILVFAWGVYFSGALFISTRFLGLERAADFTFSSSALCTFLTSSEIAPDGFCT